MTSNHHLRSRQTCLCIDGLSSRKGEKEKSNFINCLSQYIKLFNNVTILLVSHFSLKNQEFFEESKKCIGR